MVHDWVYCCNIEFLGWKRRNWNHVGNSTCLETKPDWLRRNLLLVIDFLMDPQKLDEIWPNICWRNCHYHLSIVCICRSKNESGFQQSYEIKSPPWTILWFRILGIFSVENIDRLCVLMFQTWDNSQLLIDS